MKLNSDIYHEAYKKCKNLVTKLIRSSKKHYYQTKLENSKNSKDSWKYINKLLNRKPKRTAVNQLQVDGQTVTGNENIANEFNKFFCEIRPKLAEKFQQIMLITYNTLLLVLADLRLNKTLSSI